MKKILLITTITLCLGLSVLADDGDQGAGNRKCTPTPTQPCTNVVQQPVEKPIFTKILEFLKALEF